MNRLHFSILLSFTAFAFAGSDLLGQEASANGSGSFTVNADLAKSGEKVFKSRMCNTCHSIGKGKVVGPDLKGVTDRRTADWLKVMIMTPEVALAKDTIAQRLRAEHGIAMPNMKVKPEEFEQLLHYLAAQSKR